MITWNDIQKTENAANNNMRFNFELPSGEIVSVSAHLKSNALHLAAKETGVRVSEFQYKRFTIG